jgi:hypothetical protein
MEFALLMFRNQIEVIALKAYMTKWGMPLDREVHRCMELEWANLRTKWAAVSGHSVDTQFQALALVREAWNFAVQEANVKSSWLRTGICPWNPAEVIHIMILLILTSRMNDTFFRE